mmetsp:Transcript_2732/g.3069  ORF Transcript_2732/g.3069 Transcript_2732/m.3069 type:complete len:228 (+) Transcript_2732:85-768(+)
MEQDGNNRESEIPYPEADLSQQRFSHGMWVAQFGIPEPEHAMHYFAYSPFFDKSCDNAALQMQGHEFEHQEDLLLNMKGLQYAIHHAEKLPEGGNLTVLRKEYRQDRATTKPVSTFYLINADFYQSPTVRDVLLSRVHCSSFHAHEAFKAMKSFTTFDPLTKYSWRKGKFTDEETNSIKTEGRPSRVHDSQLNSIFSTLEAKFPLRKRKLDAEDTREAKRMKIKQES